MTLTDERISNEDLFVWEMQSNFASPVDEERIKRLCKALREERKKVRLATEALEEIKKVADYEDEPNPDDLAADVIYCVDEALAKLRGESNDDT